MIFFFFVLLNNYTLLTKGKSVLWLPETLLIGPRLYCSFIDDSGCQSASLQRSLPDESPRGIACWWAQSRPAVKWKKGMLGWRVGKEGCSSDPSRDPQEMRGVSERSERRSFLLNPVASALEIRPLCTLEEGERERERGKGRERDTLLLLIPTRSKCWESGVRSGEEVSVRIEHTGKKNTGPAVQNKLSPISQMPKP